MVDLAIESLKTFFIAGMITFLAGVITLAYYLWKGKEF